MPRWPTRTTHERLDEQTYYDPNTGCWLWLGGGTHGYGSIKVAGRARYTHILTYELEIGPVPDGFELDHICRTTRCRSPYHLEPVTHRVNILRGDRRGMGAAERRRTHCPRGHPYSGDNLVNRKNGARGCRACDRARSLRNYYQRKVTHRPSLVL